MGILAGIERRLYAWLAEHRAGAEYGNFEKWFVPYNIFTKRSSHALANNETIFAAITKMSNSMGSLPLKLYRNMRHQTSHRLDFILGTAPNDYMTAFGFIQTLEVMRNVYGNAYAIKKYDSNMAVESLVILDPTRVELVQDEHTLDLWYKINAVTGTYYLHNYDVVHLRHITTGMKGVSPIDVLRGTIDYDNDIRKISIDQMKNAIKASFILKTIANLEESKKKALKAQFESFYAKNGGVIITEAGLDLAPIKSEFIDPKVFEVEKITRSRVALVFGLPMYVFGEGSEAGNEEQALGFARDALLPVVRQYELEFNRKLLSEKEIRQGYTFKFNMGGLLRADTKTRGDFYFKGIRSGLFTPNEARELEEKEPLPGGDQLFVSRDLQPITIAGTNAAAAGSDSAGVKTEP